MFEERYKSMGRLTKIDNDNFLFFDGLLEDRYYNRASDELFVGLIDDEDNAVTVAVFGVFEDGLTLRFIASDPEQAGKGYATELIQKTIELMHGSDFSFCQAVIYGELSENETAVEKILLKNNFKKEDFPLVRSIYSLADFSGIKGKAADKAISIKPAAALSAAEYMNFLELEERYRDSGFYIKADKFVKDKYCFCAVCDGVIEAFVHCEDLEDGLLIDAIYGEGKNLLLLPNLFEHIYREVIEDYSEETPVYIDTAGEKLFDYQLKLVGKEPKEKLQAYRYLAAIN